jgi:bifunctional UDP-N-acetylglucosamine pyrophosphorylase/glucosamine-1-phosphate N-acetyltransferase
MRSARAKVLHGLGGRPLLDYPLALAREVGVNGTVVVVGHQGDAVRAALAGRVELQLAEQPIQRGTGDALAVARPAISASAAEILLLYADVPLLAAATVVRLLTRHRAARAAATVLTFRPADPTGYGRIVRRAGRVRGIVEERDTTTAQRRIAECNSGVYVFDPRRMWPILERLRPDNDQGEHYLTDVIGALVRAGQRVETVPVGDPLEVAGVNDRRQLAALEAVVRGRTLDRLMAGGVTIRDPASTYVDATVTIGRDTVLDPGVRLAGHTTIGEGCAIGAGSQLADTTLGDGVVLRPYCVLDGSTVAGPATLGPFARLRPGTIVEAGADIGNFIEIKNSRIGRRVKAHHVGYLGDATVGEGANIGAGTITVNYDGSAKHRTTIGPGAFVGSNVSLVAPLTLGAGAYVGAGSVITRDVPPDTLALERAPQVFKPEWSERRRMRLRGAPTASPAPPTTGPEPEGRARGVGVTPRP